MQNYRTELLFVHVLIADERTLARGANYFFGVAGLVEVDLLTASGAHSAEELAVAVAVIVVTAAIAVAIVVIAAAVAVVIVDVVNDLFYLAEILVDLHDVVVQSLNILCELLDLLSHIVDNVDKLCDDLCFGLCFVKAETFKKTLEVCRLFFHAHNNISFRLV